MEILRGKFMEHEYRKHEKGLYLPKTKPELITVPKQKFIMIDGKGDPNSNSFAEKVGALYPIAYAIKNFHKTNHIPNGYFDYTVYPLEGVWNLSDKGKESNKLIKKELIYTIMIRQPDFITEEIFNLALENVKNKKDNRLFDEVRFEIMEDGLAVQIMHIGSYDDEPQSFNEMKEFIKYNNLKISDLRHREIYISDARKVDKEKLSTVLRYKVLKI